MDPNSLSSDYIAEKLKASYSQTPINNFPPSFFDRPPRPAAILMPLVFEQDEWRLLYIRRTKVSGDYHSGQVAFPGGGREPQDHDLQATALRETKEEVGLAAEDVNILGKLTDIFTISNFLVTPFIGLIKWPFELIISQQEVVRAFTIPLKWLANNKNFHYESRQIPAILKPQQVIYYQNFEGELLWGLSARFTVDLLKIIDLL